MKIFDDGEINGIVWGFSTGFGVLTPKTSQLIIITALHLVGPLWYPSIMGIIVLAVHFSETYLSLIIGLTKYKAVILPLKPNVRLVISQVKCNKIN